MKSQSLLFEDLSRSDDLNHEERLAVRGGILIMERPPEQGSQPPEFCGTGAPILYGWPSLPSWPTMPGWPGGPPQNGPSGPCGPARDPRLQ